MSQTAHSELDRHAGAGGTGAAQTRPLVSLILSTRNRAAYLPDCLERLSEIVTHHAWELVMIDNGSTDETWSLLSAFAKGAAVPVRLLREPRPGLARARNTGVRAASGALLCFTDDDCYPQPDFIDAMARVFEDPQIGFMGGTILLHDPQDAPVCITHRTARQLFRSGSFVGVGEIQGACMAFRRAVFEDVGLFDEAFGAGGALKAAEDCDLVIRACFAGWNGGFFPEAVIRHHHRRRANAAAAITWSYDYSRGALMAKTLLRNPQRRKMVLKQWYWDTPVLSRPSPRTLSKFWRELRGACRYALLHSWTRSPRLA